MIKTKACSYPHPVLGLTSDMDGQFDLRCEIEQNQEERTLIFHFDFEVTNEYVSELIKSRKCACVVLVTCSSTMMAWSVLDLSVPFSISEDDISGKLEIEPSIIALQCLTDYSDVSFNSIFEGLSFRIDPFDVVGVAGKLSVPIPKDHEKMGIGSIFRFVGVEHNQVISHDLECDQIQIRVPNNSDGKNLVPMMFRTKPHTSLHIFIIPALIEALKYLGAEEEQSTWAWVDIVNDILPNKSENYYEDAQKILKSKSENQENPMFHAANELLDTSVFTSN